MKNKNARIILVIIVILIAGGKFAYNYKKQLKKEEQKIHVQQAKLVRDYDKNINNNNDTIKKLLEPLKDQNNEEDNSHVKYCKINETHSLEIKDNRYYIIDIRTQEKITLENINKAYVLNVRNEDNNSEFNALFVERDKVWYLLNEKTEELAKYNGINLTEKSRLIINNGNLSIVE